MTRSGAAGKHKSETKSAGTRTWLLIIVAATVGGFLATTLSLYSGSCHLRISEEIAANTELVGANPICEFGFPRDFVTENRTADLTVPDDTSVRSQLFVGPSFGMSSFRLGAAVFNVIAWSMLFVAAGVFLGPWISRHRLFRLIFPSAVFTGIAPLFVVNGDATANLQGSTDYLAGWPVGWIVFARETEAAFYVTRIDAIHPLRAVICAGFVWLVLAYLSSWIHER
ncbi:MAG: hypothetical protein GY926_14405 [bacterium]|nr:hypothetical protein [bacterium]